MYISFPWHKPASISADVLWLLQTILTSLECSFYHGQSNKGLYCLLPCHILKIVCSALENMHQTQWSGIKFWMKIKFRRLIVNYSTGVFCFRISETQLSGNAT